MFLHAYETAVKEKYRFFSFGDAMFIQVKLEKHDLSPNGESRCRIFTYLP